MIRSKTEEIDRLKAEFENSKKEYTNTLNTQKEEINRLKNELEKLIEDKKVSLEEEAINKTLAEMPKVDLTTPSTENTGRQRKTLDANSTGNKA